VEGGPKKGEENQRLVHQPNKQREGKGGENMDKKLGKKSEGYRRVEQDPLVTVKMEEKRT